MIYITGDTHMPIDIRKLNTKNFPEQKNMTKNDYVIIAGDFGLLWERVYDKLELYWKNWLNSKNFTTLFVDGNHENHFRLFSGITAPEILEASLNLPRYKEYTIEEKFGGYVGKISDSIYHLRRGEVYTIDDRKFFTMGGAHSIDYLDRVKDITWWSEEEPNYKEFNYGLDNLERHNHTVKYILGHTAPGSIMSKVFNNNNYKIDSVGKFFDSIIPNITFHKFYCGHFHEDIVYDKFYFMFQNVIPLD